MMMTKDIEDTTHKNGTFNILYNLFEYLKMISEGNVKELSYLIYRIW